MELFYNPDLMPESELKATFVAREALVDEIVDFITRPKKSDFHHVLILAPRGMGKTTLLLMLRMGLKEGKLQKQWQAVKFPEESYGIYDVADFWVEILSNLAAETKNSELAERVTQIKSDYPQNNKLESVAIAEIKRWQKDHGCKLAVLIENYDQILNQIGDEVGIKRLHKTFNEDNSIALVGCSTAHFNDDHKRFPTKLFKTIELSSFKFEDIKELLIRRAEQDGHPEFRETVEANATRLRVLEYFTGGNPRLVLMLYRVLTYSDISEVRQALEKLLDEITPYYKSKVESLPPQQRKILDHIARTSSITGFGVTPTQIAEAVRLSPNQVSAQLKRLTEVGFVRAADTTGRKSFYLLAQPLFAVWHQMRMGRDARQRMLWFIDFLKGWYDLEELRRRATEQAERFRAYVRTGRFSEAQRVLEYQRYLAEAIHDDIAKADAYSRIIKEYLELKDKETVKQELLSATDLKLLSENTRLALFHAELITFQELYNISEPDTSSSEEAKRLAEADAANELGTASLGSENYKTAVEYYRHAIEIKPDYFRSWRNLGIALNYQDEYQEALICFERTLELNPNLPGTWTEKGHLQKKLGKPEEALQSYDRALQLEPENFEALYFRGVALWELNRPDDALEYFDRAIQVRPLSRRALAFKVSILIDLDRLDEAIKTADSTLKINPDFYESWSVRGLVLYMANQYEEAVKSYERALEKGMSPETISPEYMLSLLKAKRYDDALRHANKALEKDTQHLIALLVKGSALNEKDEYEEATSTFNQLIEQRTDLDEAWYERGYAHMQQEHVEEAISDFDQALALNPNHSLTYIYRAYLYDVKFANCVLEERFSEAEQYWAEVAKILDRPDPILRFLFVIEDHWSTLIKSGHSDFILKMIRKSGLEERLFPLVRAMDYLETKDESLLETTAAEFQKAVKLISKALDNQDENE